MEDEIVIDRFQEPVYIKELDRVGNNKLKDVFFMIMFLFVPEIYMASKGVYARNVIKILDTKTGKVRLIKELKQKITEVGR